jgi:gluconate 2-dehydrogenase gamma chain
MKKGRRRFLQSVGALSAASVASGAESVAPPEDGRGTPAPAAAFLYLTAPEVAFLEAALDRLIPADELGPGAREAAVAVFIDRQLAGAYGVLARGYRSGPFFEGTPQQGYQSPLAPREVYRIAIAETDAHCRSRHGRPFARLSPPEQDAVLHGLDEGSLELPSVSSALFFSLLWTDVQEGFFADPIYGGNRDKAGWRLVGFPGVAAVYTAHIERHGVPYRAEPVSIADVQGGKVAVDAHGHPVHTLRPGRD